MSKPGSIIPLLLPALLLVLGQPVADGETSTEEDQLRKGEMLFLVEPGPAGGLPLFQAAALIDCPPAEVWRLMNDYNHLKDFLPGVVESRVERVEGNVVYFYEEDHVPVLKNTQLLLRSVPAEQGLKKTISLVSGSVRSLEATWAFEPFDQGKTLARYTLRSDPGFYIPLWVQKAAVRRTAKGFFEGIRRTACVRTPGS